MPALSPAILRKQLASGDTAPLYLLIGTDPVERAAVAGEFSDMLMWGISGFYLGVPEPFSNLVDAMSDPDAILGDRRGDVVLMWLTRLHFGRWRDLPWLKAVWAFVGLIPAMMFVTGVIMWWNRVLRKRQNVNVDEAVA